MAKIQAPVKSYTGEVAGVAFVNGHGETENPAALAYFHRHGYTVTAESTGDKSKAPTVDELRETAKAKGIEVPAGAKKADIVALLEAADATAESTGAAAA